MSTTPRDLSAAAGPPRISISLPQHPNAYHRSDPAVPPIPTSPIGSPINSPLSPTDDRRRSSMGNGRRKSLGVAPVPRTSLAGPARAGTSNPFEPPPLGYTLRTRKRSIAIFWFIILFDSIVMPLALYFGLWYGTDLSPNTVFSIVTAALGGASIFEYAVRFWRLFKKNSTCRVIGGRRSYLDWFHWNFSLSWLIIMLELIIGTIPENPPIRLLAMPVTSLLYVFGTEMLIQDGMRLLGIPSPFRISSMPAGSQLRPGIYWVIEDVVAVDGSGGVEFREKLNARYEASHDFRQMLHRLTLFWGLGAETAAIVITILIFTLPSGDAAYCIGWAAPFAWAGVWTLVTFQWVKWSMKYEAKRWVERLEDQTKADSTTS